MIFFSAISNNVIVNDLKGRRHKGQFYEEYKLLLRSINKAYPEARAVLYVFEGEVDYTELKNIHPNIVIVDYRKSYLASFGFDVNRIKAVCDVMYRYRDHIVMVDTDTLVLNRFDDLLKDDVEITSITRGEKMYRGVKQDICIGVTIFHAHKPEYTIAYINNLIGRSIAYGEETGDWWNNVQPMVTKIYMDGAVYPVCMGNAYTGYGTIDTGGGPVRLKVVPTDVLGYEGKYWEGIHPDTRIIHYKKWKRKRTDIHTLLEPAK